MARRENKKTRICKQDRQKIGVRHNMNNRSVDEIIYVCFNSCENVCLAWQRIMKARSHLQNVKAEAYIMRYEEELADSQIDFDNDYTTFKKSLDEILHLKSQFPSENNINETLALDLADLMIVLETAVEESSIENFSYSTNDLLQAIKTDVIKFSSKYKIKTKLTGLVKYYQKPVIKKMSKNYQGKSIQSLHANIRRNK